MSSVFDSYDFTDYNRAPASFLGYCRKVCYAERVMEKASRVEFPPEDHDGDVLYTCSGCQHTYDAGTFAPKGSEE